MTESKSRTTHFFIILTSPEFFRFSHIVFLMRYKSKNNLTLRQDKTPLHPICASFALLPVTPSLSLHFLIVRKYSRSFAFLGFIRRDQADWSRSLADSRFNHGEALQNWTAVLPKRDEQPVRKFISELIQVGRRVGMEVAQPNFVALDQTGYLPELRLIASIKFSLHTSF